MSRYACKWCGREFSYAPEKTDGWVTCSESCRQQLAGSVATDKSEANERGVLGGCIVFIVVVGTVLWILAGVVKAWINDNGDDSSNTVQTEQIDNNSPSPADTESTASEPEPEPEASSSEVSTEENVPQEPVSEEPVEPIEPVAE